MTRRDAISVMIAASLAGCASSNTNPVPTTQTQDEKAFSAATQIVAGIKLTTAIVIATGAINDGDVLLIQKSEAALDKAMLAWHDSLNTSTASELEAAVFAILPTVTDLLSKGKTTRAMRVKAAMR